MNETGYCIHSPVVLEIDLTLGTALLRHGRRACALGALCAKSQMHYILVESELLVARNDQILLYEVQYMKMTDVPRGVFRLEES